MVIQIFYNTRTKFHINLVIDVHFASIKFNISKMNFGISTCRECTVIWLNFSLTDFYVYLANMKIYTGKMMLNKPNGYETLPIRYNTDNLEFKVELMLFTWFLFK